jgi:hypothetical protein
LRATKGCVIPAKVGDPALTGRNTAHFVIPAKAGIQREGAVCPNPRQQKPLDTDRDKSILIEDIVIDNPREGLMGVAIAGVRTYEADSPLVDPQQGHGVPGAAEVGLFLKET